jgi:hypothetical protein
MLQKILVGAGFLLSIRVINGKHFFAARPMWVCGVLEKIFGVDGGGKGLKTHERF